MLLQTNDLGAVLAGIPNLATQDPTRAVATERIIASVPEVQRRAIESLGASGSARAESADIEFDSARSFTDGDADVLHESFEIAVRQLAFVLGAGTCALLKVR